tara:strand:+ start:88 stop:552 length:465 start_codon:yes stop_codon:yes gene_type:complete
MVYQSASATRKRLNEQLQPTDEPKKFVKKKKGFNALKASFAKKINKKFNYIHIPTLRLVTPQDLSEIADNSVATNIKIKKARIVEKLKIAGKINVEFVNEDIGSRVTGIITNINQIVTIRKDNKSRRNISFTNMKFEPFLHVPCVHDQYLVLWY